MLLERKTTARQTQTHIPLVATPGPWKWNYTGNYSIAVSTHATNHSCLAVCARGGKVALVVFGPISALQTWWAHRRQPCVTASRIRHSAVSTLYRLCWAQVILLYCKLPKGHSHSHCKGLSDDFGLYVGGFTSRQHLMFYIYIYIYIYI